MFSVIVIREPVTRAHLLKVAKEGFGDFVKAVVDCAQGIMAIGGELHADEERVLLEQGSKQEDLWGVNLYPENSFEEWIECHSMINIRPRQGNRTRGVEDPAVQKRIHAVVSQLVS